MSICLPPDASLAELTYETTDLVFALSLLAALLVMVIFKDGISNLDRRLGALDGSYPDSPPKYSLRGTV